MNILSRRPTVHRKHGPITVCGETRWPKASQRTRAWLKNDAI